MVKIHDQVPQRPNCELQGSYYCRRVGSLFCFRVVLIFSIFAAVAFLVLTAGRPSRQAALLAARKNLLPPTSTTDENLRLQEGLPASITGPLFHVVFTTGEDTFSTLNMRCIESIFYFHPNARLLIHSNAEKGLKTIPERLQPLIEKGYHLEVVPYSAADVLQAAVDMKNSRVNATAAQQWASRLDRWKTEQYWFSNESNLLRLCLLYTTGGIYLDTDVVLVRPLVAENSIGGGLAIDNAMARNGETTFHCAVLKFLRPGNNFLAAAIDNFLQNYNGNDWGNNGPRVFQRTAKAHPELVCPYNNVDGTKTMSEVSEPSLQQPSMQLRQARDSVNDEATSQQACWMQPLPSQSFAPVKWREWRHCCFAADSPVNKDADKIVNDGVFAVHFNNHITGKAFEAKAYKDESLCDLVLNKYCIVCD